MCSTSPHHPLSTNETTIEGQPEAGLRISNPTAVLSEEVHNAIFGNSVFTLFPHNHDAKFTAFLYKVRGKLTPREIVFLERAYKEREYR